MEPGRPVSSRWRTRPCIRKNGPRTLLAKIVSNSFRGGLEQRTARRGRRCVDQRVDVAELSDRLLDGAPAGARVRHVGDDGRHRRARALEAGGRVFQLLGRAADQCELTAALGGELFGDGEAHPLSAAGHNGRSVRVARR